MCALSLRGATAVLTASLAVIGVAFLGLFAQTSVAEDTPSADVFLTRVANANGATYRARQLVVYFGRPQSAAVLDVQSTSEGEFVRAEKGTSVTKLWQRAGVGIVSGAKQAIVDDSPASVPLRPKEVLAKYEIEVGAPQKLLGVDVVPLTLKRRADAAVVERWLVHAKSGIVYRRGLYDARNRLVGMSTIIDMDWGVDQGAERFDPGSHAPSHAKLMRAPDAPKRLAQGYRLTHAYRIEVGRQRAQHWVYSDGLHVLSVFRTNGPMRAPAGFVRTKLGRSSGWFGPGPGTWAWEGGGHGYLMVAEEPALDPGDLTEPFPKGGRSVAAKMGSVWARLFRSVGGIFS
jgi:hypothetical protein